MTGIMATLMLSPWFETHPVLAMAGVTVTTVIVLSFWTGLIQVKK